MTQIDQIEVTQADRKVAARIYQGFRDPDYAIWIMEGRNAGGDYDWVIQAVARHRTASEKAAVLRGVKAGLEAAIDKLDECCEPCFQCNQNILALDPQAIAKDATDAD